MEWVKLISPPIGCVPDWAWDPLLHTPLWVVDDNAHKVFVDLNDVIRDIERAGWRAEGREWRLYRINHGNILSIPRSLVEISAREAPR